MHLQAYTWRRMLLVEGNGHVALAHVSVTHHHDESVSLLPTIFWWLGEEDHSSPPAYKTGRATFIASGFSSAGFVS